MRIRPFAASTGIARLPGLRWSSSATAGVVRRSEDAVLFDSPALSAFSDIDGHLVNTPMRQQLGVFELFDFSAKIDPVASMLTQNHEHVIRDFYGLTTSFRRDRLKPSATVLAEEVNAPWVKYIHGNAGDGTWTFLGGHDPEDPQHVIGGAVPGLQLNHPAVQPRHVRPHGAGQPHAQQDPPRVPGREPVGRLHGPRDPRRSGDVLSASEAVREQRHRAGAVPELEEDLAQPRQRIFVVRV